MVRTCLPVMILMTGCMLLVDPMFAQETSEEWTFRVTPYFVGAAMNGDITVHGRAASVDATFGDILEELEFGAMVNAVAMLGPWSFSVDGIYMGLGSTTDKPPSDIDFDQWLVEFDAGYQFNPWLGALAGIRVNALSGDIQFQGERERQESGSVYWIDPVIGTRLTARVAENWTLRGRADIGGFGIGSRLTWQLAGYVDFRASDLVAVVGGYRWIYNEYEEGNGNSLFHYDMTVSGPALGVSFIF
jgi:hypothetical protein